MSDLQKLQALMTQYMGGGADMQDFYQYFYNQQLVNNIQPPPQQQQEQKQQQQQQPEEQQHQTDPQTAFPDQVDQQIMDFNENEIGTGESVSESQRVNEKRRPVMHLERVRHKRQTLQDMARPLKHWLYQHRDNPYPTKSDKLQLAMNSQMTLTQVSNWFANARRRLKNTVRDPELNWENRIKMYNSCVEGNQELLSIDSEDSISQSEEDVKGASHRVSDVSSPIPPPPPHPVHGEQPPPSHADAPDQEPIPSPLPAMVPPTSPPTKVLPPSEHHRTLPNSHSASPHTTGNDTSTQNNDMATEGGDLMSDDHSHPHKYKQCILQRYLTDSYQHSLQQMQQGQPRDSLNSSRHRNPSGSLSSHDFEEVSTSFGGSPMREHQFDEHFDEYEEFSRQWPNIENRAEDDLYWKEISAALALTTLARSKIGSHTPPREHLQH